MQSRIKSIFSDDLFKVIGIIAIVAWMVHEFVFDTHKILLFSAIVFGLAEAAYVLAHKILKRWFFIVLCWAIYAVCLIAILKNEAQLPQEPPKVAPVIVVHQPDYIEGTEITRKQLENVFPFGYTVFYFGGNERLRYEVVTNGLLNWKIDWDNVKIEPDIAAGTVKWTIPPIAIEGPSVNIKFSDFKCSDLVPFKQGILRWPFFVYPNKPAIYVGTLSNDQRKPVFVIGFRIQTPDEMNPQK